MFCHAWTAFAPKCNQLILTSLTTEVSKAATRLTGQYSFLGGVFFIYIFNHTYVEIKDIIINILVCNILSYIVLDMPKLKGVHYL